MSTTATPATYDYRYGDTVTTVQVPLPNSYRYTKGQQALVDFAVEQGWKLDIYAVSNTYGYRFDRMPAERRPDYLVQHPFKFTKAGQFDGQPGTWKVTLDYVSREYSHYRKPLTKTLKGAKLVFVPANGTKAVKFDAAVSGYATFIGNPDNDEIVLQQQSTASYASTNWVWAAALVGEGYSLRERVQVLLTDPEAVVSRAIEARAADEARTKAYYAEQERIRQLKGRPLPAGWDQLQKVAAQVAEANGMSDTNALLAALKAAVSAVEEKANTHWIDLDDGSYLSDVEAVDFEPVQE